MFWESKVLLTKVNQSMGSTTWVGKILFISLFVVVENGTKEYCGIPILEVEVGIYRGIYFFCFLLLYIYSLLFLLLLFIISNCFFFLKSLIHWIRVFLFIFIIIFTCIFSRSYSFCTKYISSPLPHFIPLFFLSILICNSVYTLGLMCFCIYELDISNALLGFFFLCLWRWHILRQ